MLGDLGAQVVLLRTPGELHDVDGLVLPGGESTTLTMLLDSSGLADPLRHALGQGIPVFGTCAGMILLASDVVDGRADQWTFSMIDITVRRNGYGRQTSSFETDFEVSGLDGGPVHGVFIRAPLVESVKPQVEVLAALVPSGDGTDGERTPVLCRQGHVLVSAFHPELTGDLRIHELFLSMIEEGHS
jgi:5'-phosphate synthase pdxT subunit